jgi:3-hydroxybutyryl-CoA dehydratase
MTGAADGRELTTGDVWFGEFRAITVERVRWYGDGLVTAAVGGVTQVGSNVHTDEAYAREQGLSSAVADGMLATNWISSMLLARFGPSFLTGGELRTKYIRPTPVGAVARPALRLRAHVELPDQVRYELDVWVEDHDGVQLTVGDASVGVRRGIDGQ